MNQEDQASPVSLGGGEGVEGGGGGEFASSSFPPQIYWEANFTLLYNQDYL